MIVRICKNLCQNFKNSREFDCVEPNENSFFDHRFRDAFVPTCAKISLHLLSSIWAVCSGVLGRIFDSSRSCSRKNGHAYHPLPCAHQHLQYCHLQLSQCRGNDCHCCMDVSLYLLCLWSFGWICLSAVEEEEKLFEKEEK